MADESVLGIVALKGAGFIHAAKEHPALRLPHLTRANRNDMVREIADLSA